MANLRTLLTSILIVLISGLDDSIKFGEEESEVLTEKSNYDAVYIEEPADGEIISLAPGQDSIDFVAYAEGANITADTVFILHLGGRRPTFYKFSAFASDANRGMLHTTVRGLGSTTQPTIFEFILYAAALTRSGDSHAASVLASAKISVRVDPPPAAPGEYGFGSLRPPGPGPDPAAELGIRAGFKWASDRAAGTLTGPWPLPCPDMPVRSHRARARCTRTCPRAQAPIPTTLRAPPPPSRSTSARAHTHPHTRTTPRAPAMSAPAVCGRASQ